MMMNERKEIPLWDGTPPYAVEGDLLPTVMPFLVNNAKYAVVIFPGGGYFQLSVQSEGVAIAKALNEKGISAFVVRYRYAPSDGRAILADGIRAMQFVRHHASAFGLAKDKIAVLGFSAGGHLAMLVAQHSSSEKTDAISLEDSRPDACVLGYPVVTLGDGTFPTMPPIFLGENANVCAEIQKYSYSYHLSMMSATFLFYSKKDTAVDYQKNAEALYAALKEKGIVSECHAFSDGAHGIGLGRSFSDYSRWLDLAVSFLDEQLNL